jgi:hypothetical protein
MARSATYVTSTRCSTSWPPNATRFSTGRRPLASASAAALARSLGLPSVWSGGSTARASRSSSS